MIWIILAVIISIVILYYAITGYEYHQALLIVPVIAIGILLNMLMGSTLHNVCETEATVDNSQEIVALQDNYSNTEGQYFLGSGSVEGVSYYYYMINTDKGLKIEKVNTANSFLKFDEKPHIETIKYKFKNPFIRLIAYDTTVDYIIYCPEGTVNYQYNVDLEG